MKAKTCKSCKCSILIPDEWDNLWRICAKGISPAVVEDNDSCDEFAENEQIVNDDLTNKKSVV